MSKDSRYKYYIRASRSAFGFVCTRSRSTISVLKRIFRADKYCMSFFPCPSLHQVAFCQHREEMFFSFRKFKLCTIMKANEQASEHLTREMLFAFIRDYCSDVFAFSNFCSPLVNCFFYLSKRHGRTLQLSLRRWKLFLLSHILASSFNCFIMKRGTT